MNQLYILLLALWSAFNSTPAQEYDLGALFNITLFNSDLFELFQEGYDEYDFESGIEMIETQTEESSGLFEEPSITVYRQMEDGEHVFVLCKFADMSGRTYRWYSFELSVKSELNYTMEILTHDSLDSSLMCVYMVTVSPPASFTCVLEIGSDVDVRNLSSQTYNYGVSVSDHREQGVSSLYICFSSFIAVGLFFMIAAVIVTNIRSKTKDTDYPAVTYNDYVEA